MTDKLKTLGLSLALLAVLSSCASDTPEARLRQTIDTMEEAVEARQPGDFIEHVSEDFTGDHGLFDRQGLRMFLAQQMLGAEHINVVTGPLDITLQGERATVKVTAIVTGGRWLPEQGETLALTTGWRLEDGEWVCFRAERE